MSKDFSLDQIEYKPFDAINCTRESWDLYHVYRRILHQERYPNNPLGYTDEEVEKGMKLYQKHPEVEREMFVIIDSSNNEQIGEILCVMPRKGSEMYEESKEYMEFYITILENYQHKGIGTEALALVVEIAEKHEKELLATDTAYKSGKSFLQKIGAEMEIGIENRAQMVDIDWSMVEKWEKDGQDRSPNTTFVYVNSIPEEHLKQFSKLYTETYNQQPIEEIEDVDFVFGPEYFEYQGKASEEIGMKWLVMFTIEEDGEISGLTEMKYTPGFKTVITQELTGVKEQHRGRGLGKWLKASMLLKIKEEFPDIITIRTENATSNVPMLSINNRLGFKFHRESIEAQITREKLKLYLENKK